MLRLPCHGNAVVLPRCCRGNAVVLQWPSTPEISHDIYLVLLTLQHRDLPLLLYCSITTVLLLQYYRCITYTMTVYTTITAQLQGGCVGVSPGGPENIGCYIC